jgi:hypothetical protein
VLNCINCIDDEKTVWRYKDLRVPEKPAFVEALLLMAPIFKIPETVTTDIYVWTDSDSPDESNFKKVFQVERLEGIVFEKVWHAE